MFCPRLQASYSPTVSYAICSKLQMFVTFKHKSNLDVIQWMKYVFEWCFRSESTGCYFILITRLAQNSRTKNWVKQLSWQAMTINWIPVKTLLTSFHHWNFRKLTISKEAEKKRRPMILLFIKLKCYCTVIDNFSFVIIIPNL